MPPDTPPAVVLGHSLGGLVARYALMYGDTALGESGPLPPVTWAGGPRIGTLFLVATPNQGTFTALKYLEKGSFYRWHIGAFSPGTLFTFPSVFDVLPARVEPLIDRQGKALPFRLDDAADWERLGWSVVDPRRSSARPHAVLRAHLERELARHARLQAALAQIAATPNPAALYVVGSLSQTVQRTALVTEPERADRGALRAAGGSRPRPGAAPLRAGRHHGPGPFAHRPGLLPRSGEQPLLPLGAPLDALAPGPALEPRDPGGPRRGPRRRCAGFAQHVGLRISAVEARSVRGGAAPRFGLCFRAMSEPEVPQSREAARSAPFSACSLSPCWSSSSASPCSSASVDRLRPADDVGLPQ